MGTELANDNYAAGLTSPLVFGEVHSELSSVHKR